MADTTPLDRLKAAESELLARGRSGDAGGSLFQRRL